MKKLFVLTLFIPVYCFSQINQDSLNLWVNDLKNSDDYCLFDEESYKLMEYACHKIIKDSIFIPDTKEVKLNRTAKEILKREYGLVEGSPINGCIIPESIHCFETLMFKAVEHKYGAGFLDSISKHSIRLDQIGKGYIAPKFVNDSLTIYEYLSKGGYVLPKSKNFPYDDVVYINLKSNGRVADIYYFKSYDYYWERNHTPSKELRILMSNTKWRPAYLKGIAVIEEIEISLFPSYFIPKN